MATASLVERPETSVQQITAYVDGLSRIAGALSEIIDDLQLTEIEHVQHVYVLDYQEIYAFMYPLGHRRPGTGDPNWEDLLAERILSSIDRPFVFLPGTELELSAHLAQIIDSLLPLQDARLREDLVDALRDALRRLERSDAAIDLVDDRTNLIERVARELREQDRAVARVEFLANHQKRLDLRGLLGSQTVFLEAEEVRRISRLLETETSNRRRSRSENNYADALNIAAIDALNRFAKAAYDSGEALDEQGRRVRYLFHLFTHTPTLFGLGGSLQLQLQVEESGLRTTLLKRPLTVFLEQRLRHNLRGSHGQWLIRQADDFRTTIERARSNLLAVRARIESHGETLEELLRRVMEQPRQGYDVLAAEMAVVGELASVQFIQDAHEQLSAITRLAGALPSAGDQDKRPVASAVDQAFERVWAQGARVLDRCEQLDELLRTQYGLRTSEATESTARSSTDRPARDPSIAFFDAERMNFTRELDGSWDAKRRCHRFRLVRRGRDDLAFEIDVFDTHFAVFWSSTVPPDAYLEEVSRVLETTGYVPRYAAPSVLAETLLLVDREGRAIERVLVLPLTPDWYRVIAPPMLQGRVYTSRGLYFAAMGPEGSPSVAGVVMARRSVEEIQHLHAATGIVPPEALVYELSVLRGVSPLAPSGRRHLLGQMDRDITMILQECHVEQEGARMDEGETSGGRDERRRALAQKLVLSAREALLRRDLKSAQQQYARALDIDPGLGLIGELAPIRVVPGRATAEDTRKAMREAGHVPQWGEATPPQDYYWTGVWQEDEAEADRDISEDRVERFGSATEAELYLRRLLS